jgi:hypothetical protein
MSADIAKVMDFMSADVVNAMGCCPPVNVHCEKVYPAGSVAGAARFTTVPYAMPGAV